MEQHFFRDGFEDYLKEAVDNFRIYPSGKVWKGIYNSMHPGRRWPSLTVMLLLISSLLYIGITHSHQVNPEGNKTPTEVNLAGISPVLSPKTATLNTQNQQLKSTQSKNNHFAGITSVASPIAEKKLIRKNDFSGKSKATTPQNIPDLFESAGSPKANSVTNREPINAISIATNAEINSPSINLIRENENIVPASLKSYVFEGTLISKCLGTPTLRERSATTILQGNPSPTDKEWMEDFAFHHQPRAKKWKNSVDYMAYVTPSVGYRSLKSNVKFNNVARLTSPSPISNAYAEVPEVDQIPAFNFEAGAVARYHTSKNVLLTFGVQFNYTNYLVMATRMNHTSATSLLLNDLNSGSPYLVAKSSNLSNISGLAATSENNNSYQLSIPIGVDFKLAGNGKLQWYAGASIQPGLIFGGNSLLISSDSKYYISDNSLRRKWTLNSGIESYLSYKTNGGISILAGPQFRYQLFSNYINQYSFKENLYNIGMKIGVVKKF